MNKVENYIATRTVRQLLIIAVVIAVLFVMWQNKDVIQSKIESK